MSASLADLRTRLSSIPEALAATLEADVAVKDFTLGHGEGFDIVGVGASEMPARLLVSVLSGARIRARFVPISRFFGEGPPDRLTKEQTLVLFSQGLSPNARIALSHASRYRRTLVVTATAADGSEWGAGASTFVLRHGPAKEGGTLVRLVGPLCAAVLALRFAAEIIDRKSGTDPGWVAHQRKLPHVYEARSSALTEPLGSEPLACVSLGHEVEFASSLMWKWQEALYVPAPLSADVLAFAHGPLQALYERQGPLLFLQSSEPGSSELLARLQRALHPERQRVVALRASLPWPLSLFEYDAQVTALALTEAEHRGVDPSDWPGRERDEPLYALTVPVKES